MADSTYLNVCWTIITYSGTTLIAAAAIGAMLWLAGFVVMGILNLIDEFRP